MNAIETLKAICEARAKADAEPSNYPANNLRTTEFYALVGSTDWPALIAEAEAMQRTLINNSAIIDRMASEVQRLQAIVDKLRKDNDQ